jgi:hypothetical protein
MMISCKKAAKLVSQEMVRGLSRREKISLRLHLLICRLCRRYMKQVELMRTASRSLGESHPEFLFSEDSEYGEGLSPRAKDRMKRYLTRD